MLRNRSRRKFIFYLILHATGIDKVKMVQRNNVRQGRVGWRHVAVGNAFSKAIYEHKVNNQILKETFRMNSLFDMIVDYPDSHSAFEDLTVKVLSAFALIKGMLQETRQLLSNIQTRDLLTSWREYWKETASHWCQHRWHSGSICVYFKGFIGPRCINISQW